MSDERASGAPAEQNNGVADEVAGSATGSTTEGSIPVDDFNKWKSNMDAQLAARDAQINELSQSLNAVKQETFGLKTKDMSPTERAAFERDQLAERVEAYERAEREREAKRKIANGIAVGFNVPLDSLMTANSTDEMYRIAGRIVEERTSQRQASVVTPTPGNSPAPSGATMQNRSEPDISDVRREALQNRDTRTFINSFRPKVKDD